MKRNLRLIWFLLLVGLSAASAVMLYIIQGASATGADLATFPDWFWGTDYVLWGFRAMVEAGVLAYVFSTTGKTPLGRAALTVLELALVGLIALTLGPALWALGLGQRMGETLGGLWFVAWNFGIAAYTPLMIGAAGFAYRIQPDDGLDAGALLAERDALREQVAALERATAAWDAIPATHKAEVIRVLAGDDAPPAAELAERMGVSASTAARGYQRARKG